jgi:hypothetical protein
MWFRAFIQRRRANLVFPIQTIKKQEEMLFVRGELEYWTGECESVADPCLGDSVVLISPQA